MIFAKFVYYALLNNILNKNRDKSENKIIYYS